MPWVTGAVALAIGCSHAWEDLEPTGGNGGGGSRSTGSHESSGEDKASSGASSSSGGGDFVTYPASVAACVNVNVLSTDACETATGKGQMSVDQNDMGGVAEISFVRFEIDGALAGKTIDTVTLELVVASTLNSAGDHSGEVWQVSPFTVGSLNMALPPKMGATRVSPDQGSVMPLQVIKWQLPASIVTLNSGFFVGIFPTSMNSVAYWNTAGATPPRLVITYH